MITKLYLPYWQLILIELNDESMLKQANELNMTYSAFVTNIHLMERESLVKRIKRGRRCVVEVLPDGWIIKQALQVIRPELRNKQRDGKSGIICEV